MLAQGDANGELNRGTLVTQIQVDGSGQVQFQVPVPSGGSPSDMDAFGGPNVVDGEAQYDIAVDGPQTMRTSQSFDTDDIPVKVDISATLDGQSIDPTDLAGQSGLATLTYTLTNTTSEPTDVSFLDAAGNTITQEMSIATPMAGSLDTNFDSSWTEVVSEQSDAVAQNGQGGTTVGATVPLMSPPIGETEASVVIEGRVDNAVIPAIDLKVAIIAPIDTSAGRQGVELAETTGGGLQTLYEGMELLSSPTEGLGFLAAGLGTAVSGADQIATGVSDTLAPSVEELRQKASVEGYVTASNAAQSLVDTARGEDSFTTLLNSFDKLNDGLFTAQDSLAKLAKKLGGPLDTIPVTSSGDPDLTNATIGGGLTALLFGINKASAGKPLTKAISGLTNPQCDYDNPTNPNQPCGAWQVLDIILGQLDFNVPQACRTTLTDCALPGNSPGASALLELLTEVQVDPNGYTGDIGQDQFQGLLKGNSILELIEGHNFGSGVCSIPGYPTPTPPALVSCGGAVDLQVSKLANLALISGQFAEGLAEGFGQQPVNKNNAQTTLRGGLYGVQQGLVGSADGIPNGCKPDSSSPYNCKLDAQTLGLNILIAGNYDAANIVNGLQVLALKTDNNPTNQFPADFALYDSTLQFGVCPGGNADPDIVEDHCSATQVIGFLQAGLAGWKKNDISEGKIDDRCPVVPSQPWIPPVDGSDPGTTPEPPNSDTVENAGATCAVRTLKNSVNRILLPSLGNGVQQQTLDTIGSGQFTPNCDPNVTGTLTCALSVLQDGISGPQEDSLENGTRTLADGLPDAEAGAQAATDAVTGQIMPGINDNVETANETVAVIDSLSERAFSGANVPGGAAVGVSSNQGVYAFEFASAGGPNSDSLSRFGLAALFLLIAAGAGYAMSTRKA